MSVRVMAWVWDRSQADPVDRLVLLAIADSANDSGGDAYPSMARLTVKTGLHERSVQRSVIRLVAAGELSVVPRGGPKGCNLYRVLLNPGTAPPPAECLPGDAPPRHSAGGPGTAPPRQSATPADSHPDPGTAPGQTPAQRHPNHPLTIHDPSENLSSSATPTKRQRRRRQPVGADRPDVERVCTHLADRVEANGSKRPRITAKWRDAARLMIDTDGRDVEKIIRAIDWCQADDFWRGNVLSMPTLRRQYDRLRLAAQRNGNARASPKPSTTDTRVAAALALAAELEAREITA